MISLNETEIRLAEYVAKKRIQHNRASGAVATVYGDRDPMFAELNYYGAELAFCKLFNLYPDINHVKRKGQDCMLAGKRVDIKWTHRHGGRLMAKVKGWDDPPDLFAMMIGTFPSYTLAGFMKADDLLQPSRIDNSLAFPAYTATQKELFQWLW